MSSQSYLQLTYLVSQVWGCIDLNNLCSVELMVQEAYSECSCGYCLDVTLSTDYWTDPQNNPMSVYCNHFFFKCHQAIQLLIHTLVQSNKLSQIFHSNPVICTSFQTLFTTQRGGKETQPMPHHCNDSTPTSIYLINLTKWTVHQKPLPLTSQHLWKNSSFISCWLSGLSGAVPGEATDHQSHGSSCSITELKLLQSALITLSKVHCRAFVEADEDLPAVTNGGRLWALITGVQQGSMVLRCFKGMYRPPCCTIFTQNVQKPNAGWHFGFL